LKDLRLLRLLLVVRVALLQQLLSFLIMLTMPNLLVLWELIQN